LLETVDQAFLLHYQHASYTLHDLYISPGVLKKMFSVEKGVRNLDTCSMINYK